MTVTGWPVTTLCRGTVVCDAGGIMAEAGHDVFLPRGAYDPVPAAQLVT